MSYLEATPFVLSMVGQGEPQVYTLQSVAILGLAANTIASRDGSQLVRRSSVFAMTPSRRCSLEVRLRGIISTIDLSKYIDRENNLGLHALHI